MKKFSWTGKITESSEWKRYLMKQDAISRYSLVKLINFKNKDKNEYISPEIKFSYKGK